MSFYDFEGRNISKHTRSYSRSVEKSCEPAIIRDTNFDFNSHLILSRYGVGDLGVGLGSLEILGKVLSHRLGEPVDHESFRLAISRKTGHLSIVDLFRRGRTLVMNFCDLEGYYAPKEHLGEILEGLSSAKRPFYFDLPSAELINFLQRDIGYQNLGQHLIVVLQVNHGKKVHISHQYSRVDISEYF